MRDLAFYNAGGLARGWRKGIDVPRRLIRRLLRPYFQRLEQILQALAEEDDRLRTINETLAEKVDGLSAQVAGVEAFGWDHVALARRLAALEDEVERLRGGASRGVPSPHRPGSVGRALTGREGDRT